MSLSPPNEIAERTDSEAHRLPPLEALAAPPLQVDEGGALRNEDSLPQSSIIPEMSRWPLVAIAVAALMTLIWNAFLVWTVIEAIFS